MANENKPQSDGAIYPNSFKKAQNQPDHTGKIELNKDFMKELVEDIKAGKEPILRVALWDRVSKNDNPYMYARVDVAQPKPEAKPEPQPEKKAVSSFDPYGEDDIEVPF